jgi:GNAT superfamily N-acetyltransferase
MKKPPSRDHVIRSAAIGDAHGIAAVQVASWRDAYKHILPNAYLAGLDETSKAAWWEAALIAGTPYVLVAVRNNMVIGWIAFGVSRDTDHESCCAEIHSIYLRSEWWGLGIGTTLMNAACERLKTEDYSSVTLWVYKANRAALSFYAQRGFKHDGTENVFEIGGVLLNEVRFRADI